MNMTSFNLENVSCSNKESKLKKIVIPIQKKFLFL